jgi:hypothetical protein
VKIFLVLFVTCSLSLGVSHGDDDWREKKLQAYRQAAGGLRDKYGNVEGRSFDLGGESRLKGQVALLVLCNGGAGQSAINSPLASALRKRIEVEVIERLPESVEEFSTKIKNSTQLWIWAGDEVSCLPTSHLQVICNRLQQGMSTFCLADNSPFTKGCESVLVAVSRDARIAGNYIGEQLLEASESGPGFDGKHPIFHGITRLWEGRTIATISGSRLKPIARSSTGEALICVAETPPGHGRVLVTGGFTAFYREFWDAAGTERLALNAAAFLAGVDGKNDKSLSQSRSEN